MATIRKRGENVYQFIVSYGLSSDGTYGRKYKTYRVNQKFTPKQLEKHLENEAYKFEQKVKSTHYFEPDKITFSSFCDRWEKKYLEDEGLSENTISLRLGSLKNHILPVIGQFPISRVTTIMIIDLMDNLSRKDGKEGDLSISSKQEVYKALSSIFSKAIEWKVIKENPMDGISNIKNKKNRKNELNVYSEEELKVLMESLKDEPNHWRIFIILAFTTGMRRGELLGLTWNNVDLQNGIIRIRQIISKSRDGVEVKEPKFNSVRDVSISKSLIKELEQYKENSIDLMSNISDEELEWVFFNEQGDHLYPDTPTTWWRRFLARRNFRVIRLHDLRHTSATLLIAQNIHAKIISERLGHSKISTTMDIYGHVLPATDREASDSLESIFG